MDAMTPDRLGEIRVDNDLIALAWHFSYHLRPKPPMRLIPTCQQALAALRADELETVIAMPDGISFEGCTTATAAQLRDALHLDLLL